MKNLYLCLSKKLIINISFKMIPTNTVLVNMADYVSCLVK